MSMETAREFGHDVGLMENEIDRLRAGLTRLADDAKLSAHRAERAETAIARVRELCEDHMWDLEEDERGLDTIQTIRILRALDGGTE